jgi:diamine N-acetyltransferase
MTTPQAEIHLESERVIVRDMKEDDLREMEAWRPFDDPWYKLWNIQPRTSLTRAVWLLVNSRDTSRLWLTVERRSDGQVIGSVTLREAVPHVSARLGVTFGADYVDQGLGTEALSLFLKYYFKDLAYRQLRLDVAATNQRARHVYEKLGFHYVGQQHRTIPADIDLSFLGQSQFSRFSSSFRRRAGRLQLLYFDMVLLRDEYLAGQ